MNCATDIQKYNTILQEDRVYIFLDGLDDWLDKIQSDVLQIRHFPTIEQAYAHVRQEKIQQAMMLIGTDTIGAVMASKGVKIGQQQPPSLQLSKNGFTGAGKLNTNTRAKTQ